MRRTVHVRISGPVRGSAGARCPEAVPGLRPGGGRRSRRPRPARRPVLGAGSDRAGTVAGAGRGGGNGAVGGRLRDSGDRRRPQRDRRGSRGSSGPGRRRARRSRLGPRPARHRVRADAAGRGPAGFRADRGPHRLHRGYHLLRCRLLRPGSVRDHRHRQPPRLVPCRQRQLPAHPRHLPRPAERLHLRHQPLRPGVRRAARQRGGGRQRHGGGVRRRRPDRRRRRRLQPELGRRVAGAHRHLRGGLDGGVRHPVPHAALSRPAGSRPGASTSSATSAGATSRRTGRRCRGNTTCSASRSPDNWAASGRPRGSGARCR